MSRTRFFAFVWIFFIFLLQNTVNYLFGGKTPPLLLISVIFYSLQEGPFFGMALGLYAGMFLEIFSAGPLGFQMLILSSCGGMSGFIASKIFGESVLVQVLLPSLMFYFAALFDVLILKARLGEIAGLSALVDAFRPFDLVVTALVSPWVFSVLRKMSRRSFSRSTGW